MTLTTLPQPLTEMVESYMASAGDDFSSRAAMEGRCQDHSLALADAIVASERPLDSWGDDIEIDAYAVQIWMDEVPEELEGNELAGGHYVVMVEYDGLRYEIDITAAQFPELGWTGPRTR